MKKAFWILLAIVVAVILAADIFLLFCGSLETFPTAEQMEKTRIAYGSVFVLLIIVEAFILIRILRLSKSK